MTGLCAIGILLNVLPAFLAAFFQMPFFFDVTGTILVSYIGGYFPGIVTAIVSNAICMAFNPDALYFAAINALVAVCTVAFKRKHSFGRAADVIIYIVTISVFCGIATSLVQWMIFGKPQNPYTYEMSQVISSAAHIPEFISFLLVNIIVNLLDKGLATAVVIVGLRLIPEGIIRRIREYEWRQRPLTDDEVGKMREWGDGVHRSIWKRMSLTLIAVSVSAVVIMGIISIRLYFQYEKTEKTENARNAAKFAASVIDADRIDAYIRNGRQESGYTETEEMLYRIRQNAPGVEYLYVVKIEKDGCYYAFDLDTDDVEAYEPGDKNEFEEAFMPYLPALFAGEEIDPIESDDITGWVQTVYYPIRNSLGVTKGYVGADVSLEYMAGMMREFATKVFLVLAGFLFLILSYGMWTTKFYTVYPIGSIALSVDSLSGAGDDQTELDDNVRALSSLEIHTDDEVEKLYKAICTMAADHAEQMREVRYYSESTARMQDGLIITMADMVENRDSDTGAHIQKTAAYVRIIVEGLQKKGYYGEKITPKFISDIVRSAPLHDVGKINIPDEVLNKPGKLTDEEYEIMKTHTTAGKKIIEKTINTINGENYLKEARNMAAYHHERWDGRGYPEGLHGEVIPLSARIMAVADVFDALTSPRVYKPAFPLEKALAIMEEGSGTQFDPKCIEVFLENLDEAKIILKKYNE